MLAFLTKFDFSMDESHQYPPKSSIFYRMLARFHVSYINRAIRKLLVLIWLFLPRFCFWNIGQGANCGKLERWLGAQAED